MSKEISYINRPAVTMDGDRHEDSAGGFGHGHCNPDVLL